MARRKQHPAPTIPTNHAANLLDDTREYMQPIIDLLNTIPVPGLRHRFTLSAGDNYLELRGPTSTAHVVLDGSSDTKEQTRSDALQLLRQIEDDLSDIAHDVECAISWLEDDDA